MTFIQFLLHQFFLRSQPKPGSPLPLSSLSPPPSCPHDHFTFTLITLPHHLFLHYHPLLAFLPTSSPSSCFFFSSPNYFTFFRPPRYFFRFNNCSSRYFPLSHHPTPLSHTRTQTNNTTYSLSIYLNWKHRNSLWWINIIPYTQVSTVLRYHHITERDPL